MYILLDSLRIISFIELFQDFWSSDNFWLLTFCFTDTGFWTLLMPYWKSLKFWTFWISELLKYRSRISEEKLLNSESENHWNELFQYFSVKFINFQSHSVEFKWTLRQSFLLMRTRTLRSLRGSVVILDASRPPRLATLSLRMSVILFFLARLIPFCIVYSRLV